MIIAVLSGFIASILSIPSQKYFKDNAKYFLSLFPLVISIYLFSFLPGIANGQTFEFNYIWFPELGVNLSFYLDGLSITFALMISVIGFFVIMYGGDYLKGDVDIVKFYFFILAFMGSMLGVVLSSNLLCLFIFWELTSITSYFLIGYKNKYQKARDAALQALLVTGLGGLALLAGVILMSKVTGSFNIAEILSSSELLQENGYASLIMIFFLIAAFTKSAQFPFYFWLPNAMEAPTPVSAYLHSATMVKAGVYLVARMNETFSVINYWSEILIIFGGITMVLGAFFSFGKDDLKQILAFTTVSSLGTLVFLVGVGNEYALKAFAVFLIVHSLYKGTLFLVAGAIDHSTGTRSVSSLSGLRKKMPVTFYAGLFAALSSIGLIPFIGFVAKEYMYDAGLSSSFYPEVLITALIVTNVIVAASGILAGIKPFLGKVNDVTAKAHEASFGILLGPVLMATACLLFGLLIPVLSNTLLEATAASINSLISIQPFKLWAGFNFVFVLSLLTIVAGIILYYYRNIWLGISSKLGMFGKISPVRVYEITLKSVLSFATFQTRKLQNGYLRVYLIVIILTATGLVGVGLFRELALVKNVVFDDVQLYEILICLLVIISAVVCIRAKSMLYTVVTLGVIGYAVAGIFLMYGAPDLAMTQFAIETLTVILFVLVLYKLPEYIPATNNLVRLRDLAISVSFGVLITLIVIVLTEKDLTSNLSEYYSTYSYLLAKGKNVVNVILVDFRSIDTLGEITVLVIAALGVYALLRLSINDKTER